MEASNGRNEGQVEQGFEFKKETYPISHGKVNQGFEFNQETDPMGEVDQGLIDEVSLEMPSEAACEYNSSVCSFHEQRVSEKYHVTS